MIQLGNKCKDKVTGYEGIAIGRAEYLTGCIQYGIVREASSGGKVPAAEWFDEGRLEITGNGVLDVDVAGPTNGGPNRDAPRI